MRLAQKQLYFMGQQSFLDLIRKRLPDNASIIDEIATVLDISYDAAHRRVSLKSKLSLEESILLAKHFGISIDRLFTNKDEYIVAVKKTAPVKDMESLLTYYENSYKSLVPFTKEKDLEIIYSAKDLPIFYTSGDDQLAKFKIYAWLKILNPNTMKTSFRNFNPSLSLLEAAKKLGSLYEDIKASEIWDITTINSTLKQIHFYFESNFLTSQEAISICNDLTKLIQSIEDKLIQKKDDFKLYHNELLLMNNRVLFRSSNLKSLYVPYTILSYYRTNDIETCNEVEDFLNIQMEGSKLLNTAGQKEKTMFFNKIYKKIEALKSLISAKNVLEFE